jgi:asparagine synthase (glutamine-hydrolysing)
MFAFALWDEANHSLFCARDKLGIKPFYYALSESRFAFASEAKTLLSFLPKVETDLEGLKDYLTFQFCLDGKTLFKGIRELPPGHTMLVESGSARLHRYWQVRSEPDFDHTQRYFEETLRASIRESVSIHLRSDVPVGAYVSGGIDSSSVASIASELRPGDLMGFNGRFPDSHAYDESHYAHELARAKGIELCTLDMSPEDLVENLQDIIYHLDYPIAGPGSVPQYLISRLAARHRKVLLGGQGGDELFGGYARYLIAYFEQCIKAAIDGTVRSGEFIVTYETILPNLRFLANYKPLLQEFWKDGLFDDLDRRYFRLINRAPDISDEVNWELLGDYSPFDTFRRIFLDDEPVHRSYLDKMLNFDLRTLLPALLHVEDRVSMAHGLESRVPLLDPPIVELATSIPSNIKFTSGDLKHILKKSMQRHVPDSILRRTDKMGFPVPLQDWIVGHRGVQEFIGDVLSSKAAICRNWVNNAKVLSTLRKQPKFGRKGWGFICLEIWHQIFHDQAASLQRRVQKEAVS